MLLAEECKMPPSDMRTIRLSTPSFLDSILTEGSPTPLYTVKTDDDQTRLLRHDKKEGSEAGSELTEVALIHWSDMDSPDSSPVDSESFASRWVKSWGHRDTSDRSVVVDVDGRRLKLADLLRTAAFGGSRKFTVDGKSFKWKHINGLWQCFYLKNRMIAVFEPSIVTAVARIRILATDVSVTRRIFDMIVLTCLLVVTHPTEWRRHAKPQGMISIPRYDNLPALQAPPTLHDPALRRTHSYDGERGALLSYTSGNGNTITLVPSTFSGQRSPPSVATSRASQVLAPLVIPTFTTRPSMTSSSTKTSGLTSSASLRRTHSINDLPSSTNTSTGVSPAILPVPNKPNISRAMSIVSRASSTREKLSPPPRSNSLGRSPSSSSLSAPRGGQESGGSYFLSRRPTLTPLLSPVADESAELPGGSQDGHGDSPGEMHQSMAPRPWEVPNAYPMPYTATSSSTEFSPPPYARRDPNGPPPGSMPAPAPASVPVQDTKGATGTPPSTNGSGSLGRRLSHQANAPSRPERSSFIVIS